MGTVQWELTEFCQIQQDLYLLSCCVLAHLSSRTVARFFGLVSVEHNSNMLMPQLCRCRIYCAGQAGRQRKYRK